MIPRVHRPALHPPAPHRARSALALAALALTLAACSGGSGPKGIAPAAQAAQATPFSVATPLTLPVTPVAATYTVADPKFDPLPGARAIYGEDSGGAYQIEVPQAWNGDVVYFAHGFRGNIPQLIVSAPPIRQFLVDHGYAWAASSFSQNGYAPGAGARDTYALRAVFAQKVGAPRHQYLYGQSMGGHVVAYSLEHYPTAYDGALSECGVVAGHEILDYFLSWGALAGYFSGADFTSAATDAGLLGQRLKDTIPAALGLPGNLTAKGRAFEDAIENLTGGPRPFFEQGFALQYAPNFLVLLDAATHPGPGNAAADNARTLYRIDPGFGVTGPRLNREIARVAANPAYTDRAAYPEFAPETGKIERPLLTLHGTGDLFVPISQELSYRKIVDAAGRGNLLVQRAIRRPGHCNFSPQEREQAFTDLVAWVTRGQKPAGDDLSGDLTNVGLKFTTPLAPGDPGSVTTP
ncbi:MAG: alpha/beta hydrolase family protein [Dehalococcoidia bacterium]